jgi:hypothetical protein
MGQNKKVPNPLKKLAKTAFDDLRPIHGFGMVTSIVIYGDYSPRARVGRAKSGVHLERKDFGTWQ